MDIYVCTNLCQWSCAGQDMSLWGMANTCLSLFCMVNSLLDSMTLLYLKIDSYLQFLVGQVYNVYTTDDTSTVSQVCDSSQSNKTYYTSPFSNFHLFLFLPPTHAQISDNCLSMKRKNFTPIKSIHMNKHTHKRYTK